jgi:TonB family protein
LGYSYYLNVILTRISDNWLNPYAGDAKVLTATVVFTIERDGMVKEVKIEKKSGDAAYDASCERALLVLDRLPPLPPEFTGPRLKLHLEFEQKPYPGSSEARPGKSQAPNPKPQTRPHECLSLDCQ